MEEWLLGRHHHVRHTVVTRSLYQRLGVMTSVTIVFSPLHVRPQALLKWLSCSGVSTLLPRVVEGVGHGSGHPGGSCPLQYPKETAEPERNDGNQFI